jgi:NAD+ kinase
VRIGILAHPRRPESIAVALQVQAIAQHKHTETWLRETWNYTDIRANLLDTDFVVAIGGDGAMLQAARACAPFRVPVFGLNMGYLGFLTEASPEQWSTCLDRILAKEYWVETRLMIIGEIWRKGNCLAREEALNDVVVSRGGAAKAIRLDAYIDDDWITTYNADGLIIATATGSTAYALAVGGPIMPPDLDNILMVPVAPHFSMERPVILSQGAQVKVIVSPLTQAETAVSIDGQTAMPLEAEDEVRVHASENRSLFIRLQGRNYFFRSLMDRMEPRFLPRYPLEKKK